MRCFVIRYICHRLFLVGSFSTTWKCRAVKKFCQISGHVLGLTIFFLFESVNLPIFPKDCPRTKDLIAIWSAILTSGLLDLGMEAEMNIWRISLVILYILHDMWVLKMLFHLPSVIGALTTFFGAGSCSMDVISVGLKRKKYL